MALPMLERYSLDQAILFIKRELGEEITTDELLEYAINGHIKISVFIKVVGDLLCKIGNQECRHLKLQKFTSPILHNDKFPVYGNSKSFLHKKIASFSDGLLDIQAGFFMCDDSKDLCFQTQTTEEPKYPLCSYLLNGNLTASGLVYLSPQILNKIQTAIRDDKTIFTDDFSKLSVESVELEDSNVKCYFDFELETDDLDYNLSDDDFIKECSNSIAINDLVILKDDLARFVQENQSYDTNQSLDNALYLIAEMLRATKSKSKKWTQGTIIDEILSQRELQNEEIKGLEKRTIEEYFSTANKKLKSN